MTVRRIPLAAIAALAVVVITATGAVAGPWGVAPGEYYSELSGSVFSAGTFYNDFEDRLPNGGLSEQRVLSSYNELGWTKHFSLVLGLPVVSRTVTSNALRNSTTNTGLGDILVGVKHASHLGSTPMSIGLRWTAPMGTNHQFKPGVNTTPGTAGDAGANDAYALGLQSLQADVAVGGSAGKRAYWALQGGYRYRYSTIGGRTKSGSRRDTLMSERRWQDALLAQAELGIWLSRSVLLTGQFHADMSVDQGDLYDGIYTTGSSSEFETKRMLAGPRVTYRVDDKLDAFAGSWHTPGGRNTLHTDQYYAGIAWKSTKLDRLAGLLGSSKSR